MSAASWIQFGALIALLALTAPPLGRYIARVYGDGRKAPGDRVFLPVERLIYRVCRVTPDREQRWTAYALSVLAFSSVSFLLLYGILRLQGVLPLNPQGVPGFSPGIAFNVAVSFMTNTNWQAYSGENSMSHLSQMSGLTVQNFVSASVGIAVMAALIRGLARRRATTIGNFWVDLTRGITRILLPLSVLVALVLVSQGVVQNFTGQTLAHTLEGAQQAIPGGPVASQVAIKQIGSNGGGFFNANSAHPLENPTALSDFVELWAILILPFALAFTFGHMVRDRRQGRAVFAIMLTIWAGMSLGSMLLEGAGNSAIDHLGVDQTVSSEQSGGNMEGKEIRFGAAASGLWAASTTGTSNGSVNAMHDSFTPLGGGLSLTHMMLGEVSPGGVGVGLSGLLILAILSVFIAGLMIGRTPEYLGKKIQATEMKLVMLYLMAAPATVLIFSSISAALPSTRDSLANPGPHGLTELLYAYTSAANNNGSAFGGFDSTTPWFATSMGLAMLIGRFLLIIPVLALAGSMASKQVAPRSAGTFPTHTPLFIALVIGVAVVVAGLMFFPTLALGPIVEHLSL